MGAFKSFGTCLLTGLGAIIVFALPIDGLNQLAGFSAGIDFGRPSAAALVLVLSILWLLIVFSFAGWFVAVLRVRWGTKAAVVVAWPFYVYFLLGLGSFVGRSSIAILGSVIPAALALAALAAGTRVGAQRALNRPAVTVGQETGTRCGTGG